jgi:hypothetical protein
VSHADVVELVTAQGLQGAASAGSTHTSSHRRSSSAAPSGRRRIASRRSRRSSASRTVRHDEPASATRGRHERRTCSVGAQAVAGLAERSTARTVGNLRSASCRGSRGSSCCGGPTRNPRAHPPLPSRSSPGWVQGCSRRAGQCSAAICSSGGLRADVVRPEAQREREVSGRP